MAKTTNVRNKYTEEFQDAMGLNEIEALAGELDHPDLQGSNAIPKYKKLEALVAYFITGNSAEVENLTGVNRKNIWWWKTQTSWFPELLERVRQYKNEELDLKLSNIIEKGLYKLNDRIEKGDEVVDKNGETHYRAVSGRDMAIIIGTVYDKRALLRGDPTQRVENSSMEEKLGTLKERFERFAQTKTINHETQQEE